MLFQRLLARKRSASREDILDQALHLAMAFGKSWQVPIHSRLSKHYPSLTERELNDYNDICQAAMSFAHDTIFTLAQHSGIDTSINEFKAIYSKQYPWVSEQNIKRLFNQGMYYAQKDMAF